MRVAYVCRHFSSSPLWFRPLSRRRSPNSPPEICPPKIRRKITARRISRRILLTLIRRKYLPPPNFFGIFITFHHALLIFMYFLHLQTSIVWFSSLFSEGHMYMCKNFKLFCCDAYILNSIVSICLSYWPNLWCSGVFSAEFRSFRKIRLIRISAENMVQPAEFF